MNGFALRFGRSARHAVSRSIDGCKGYDEDYHTFNQQRYANAENGRNADQIVLQLDIRRRPAAPRSS
jgi:hypothetical protein